MNSNERNCLTFFMEWRDKHLDDRGVGSSPGRFTMRCAGVYLGVAELLKQGYLTYSKHSELQPTAKATVWWIEQKRERREGKCRT